MTNVDNYLNPFCEVSTNFMSQKPIAMPKYRILERDGVFRVQKRHMLLGFLPIWKLEEYVPFHSYEWEPFEFPSFDAALSQVFQSWDRKHLEAIEEAKRNQKQKSKKWKVVKEI